jgi:hypothetical protein
VRVLLFFVSASFDERAARRRAEWQGGVARSFEEMERHDLEFWLRATPGERIRAIAELAATVAALKGDDGRLQRSVGGVRPRVG